MKKRICLVIPSLQAGGMERVMSELISFISKQKDIEQHLVLYGITREIFYPVPESIAIHRPSFIFNNRFRLFSTVRTLIYLRKEIKRIDPDSILSFGEYWNSFVLLALTGYNYPIYISDRCQPDKKLDKLHEWLRIRLYPKASGIIAQTGKAKEVYQSLSMNTNISVIGNPIRSFEMEAFVHRENIVLMVGRLIKTKNHDKLIELFLKISKPGWKLVIVGYDHLKQKNFNKLKKIISDNHAEDSVFLEGKQENVDNYYLRSKIFAFTSSSEGFPNVIGEAMAAGVPVIAFDCVAGPSEMIKDKWNGFLVPLFDYKMFQEKLEFLMDQEEVRKVFGSRANESIKAFSIESIGEKYLKFILNQHSLVTK